MLVWWRAVSGRCRCVQRPRRLVCVLSTRRSATFWPLARLLARARSQATGMVFPSLPGLVGEKGETEDEKEEKDGKEVQEEKEVHALE